ncbi:hypothetical protein COLO4_28997 [Corchorus olitorius]|uniref:Uncharacterized protein n=1 Tax=Corchorus olitorius TaxID=93759 RepID=A0A1R3HH58_9ROSI|nr:hypothetical protein COLO4_28997 [Corchorus olitorius]
MAMEGQTQGRVALFSSTGLCHFVRWISTLIWTQNQ